MTPLSASPHLDESQLLHLIDRDADDLDLSLWNEHALACDDCAARLRLLRHRSERLSALLDAVEIPVSFPTAQQTMRAVPHRRTLSIPVWLRAAAVIVLLLLPVAFVAPLRALVVEWAHSGAARVTALFEHPAPPTPPPPAPRGSSTLWFAPAGDELTLRFASPQQAGSLVVTPTSGAEASIEIEDGDTEVPLVTESEIRVQNRPSSTASYRVTIPRALGHVRILIGTHALITLSPGEITGERVIPLRE